MEREAHLLLSRLRLVLFGLGGMMLLSVAVISHISHLFSAYQPSHPTIDVSIDFEELREDVVQYIYEVFLALAAAAHPI